MSRKQSRARKRRARIEELRVEFVRARDDPEAFPALLDRLAASDTPVWAVAQAAAAGRPLNDDERAMIAQAVAPHLAGMTPGSVHQRYARA